MTLKICVAQLNLVVGDMTGNAGEIVVAARAAYQQGVRLVLTPELSICGYAAEDLFLRQAFTNACDDAVKAVALALADLKDLSVVVGHPTGGDQQRQPGTFILLFSSQIRLPARWIRTRLGRGAH